ncbi:hypothetical protein RHGRI_007572 [Rhododendron griersonianum]|uniref:Uncharacterized protein n=1 Tax=Rhododendron griersonianum TaxID=479676 RepID=A0AAV6KY33_9ERIC|nr:hypothetical protein RHGRI_007572 [Rhododendron griersonianum]
MDSIGCKYFVGGGAIKVICNHKCTQEDGYPRCDILRQRQSCSQVVNVCEGVKPIVGEDASRSYSRVN